MTTHTPTNVDAATVIEWHADDPDAVVVLDVRTPAEFNTRHIAGSHNLPLHLLSDHAQALTRVGRTIVLVCQSGSRADQALRRLTLAGLTNAHVLTGGVPAFAEAGGPVVEGLPRWALERQVRLVAGTLVLAGIISARLVHPKAVVLAGGIGAGLTVSAVTDTCTLGRLLSLLPHNRVAAPDVDQLIDRLTAGRPPS